jgi:hypothetical protein
VPDLIAPSFFLVAALLLASGVAKLRQPGHAARALAALHLPNHSLLVRGLGIAEIAVGGWALLAPSAWAGLAVALLYSAFAVFLGSMLVSRTDIGCGCAGSRDAPASPVHVALDLCAVAVAATAAAQASQIPSAPAFLASQPLQGLPLVLAMATLGYALWVLVSELPSLMKEIRRSTRLGHRHGVEA